MNVCKKLFLALGPVHRVETLVKDAWEVSARSLGSLKLATAGPSKDAMAKLLKQAQDYAAGLNGQLLGQRDAFNEANGAKMDVSAFA